MVRLNTGDDTLELDLWLVDPSTIRSMQLLTRYYETLNANERERHSQFASPALKHNFLVTRALIRDVLSRTVLNSIIPSAWTFTENEYGRPAISNPEFQGKLHFNISHTDKLIVCMVSPIYSVGIDVENVTRNLDYLTLAKSCFSRPEVENLLQQKSLETMKQRFFEYWTLKEAYIKARGMGLSLPLEHFHYQLESRASAKYDENSNSSSAPALVPADYQISITFEAPIIDLSSEWEFKVFRLLPDHLVSIAAKTGGKKIRIHVKYLSALLDSLEIPA